MKQHDDKNWLDDVLSEHLGKQTGEFDFEQWSANHPEEARQLREINQSKEKTITTLWSIIGSTIMKSPYTKFGMVAVSLLIGLFFLFPSKGISPDSIAWADVQRKIMDQHNCMITGTRILTTKEENPQVTHLTVHKYLSREYGYLDETYDEQGDLLISIAVHHPSKVVTILFPQTKRYAQFPIPQKYQEKMKDVTPVKLFAILFYSGDYEDLEDIDLKTFDITELDCVRHAKVKGIEAVGFECSGLIEHVSDRLGFDKLPLVFDVKSSEGVLWINPETLLPIQLEADLDIGSCVMTNFREMELCEVDEFFGWNIEMDEAMFLPAIPEDYELFGAPEIKTSAVLGVSGMAAGIPLFIWIKKRRKRKTA